MTEQDLLNLIQRHKNTESEIIEFKEWKDSIPFLNGGHNDNDKKKCVYGYCVGIGNELGGQIIIGVNDKGQIVGTKGNLKNDAKRTIFDKTGQKIGIEEIITSKGKVIIIDIPTRQSGQLLKFNGIPLMRINDSLKEMNDNQIKKILNESDIDDFSIKICKNASLDDLDPEALKKAKEMYIQKNPDKKDEIVSWNDITFLNKAKITINGAITNTAIILLGKPESEHYISPSVAKISWILKNRDGIELDYEHFGPPFILSVEKVFRKIRNLKYRYIKDNTLFPEEVDTYEPYIIREALNNCIAHQDYNLAGKINIIEKEDSLIFTNSGSFIPKTIENVIESDTPSEYYRNRFLSDAMVNLKMIDTIGSGIRKMFDLQRNKYFPLPDYDLSNNKVSVVIIGKVLDINYARKLALSKNTLTLFDIMLLDKVQKKKELSSSEILHLRKNKLIEGRKPNYHISFEIAQNMDQKGDYIKQRGFKDNHYKNMILEYLRKYKSANKNDIDKLLFDILPTILNKDQKKNKIRNIIYAMSKKDKIINNKGTNRNPIWKII